MYKVFDGGTIETAKYFLKSPTVIYNHCSRPREFFNYFGFNLRFESKLRNKIVIETKDETRRRLGLNPYGEWRTDEWIYAMVERISKQHPELTDPNYDPAANKKYRLSAEKRKVEGEWFDPKIDTRGYML